MAWPEQTGWRRVIRGAQNTVPVCTVQKPPLLPSQYLQQLEGVQWTGVSRQLRLDLLIMMVCQFFGWRAVALASIRIGGLQLEPLGSLQQLRVVKWDDKTMSPTAAKPMGLMSFPRLPWLQEQMVAIVGELSYLPPKTALLDFAYPGIPRVQAVGRAMDRLMAQGGVRGLSFTSHCGRVGCCTALMSLGMDLTRLNLHVGWKHGSDTAIQYYNRPGTQLRPFDSLFYFAALPFC